jgi:hypothetical protein
MMYKWHENTSGNWPQIRVVSGAEDSQVGVTKPHDMPVLGKGAW